MNIAGIDPDTKAITIAVLTDGRRLCYTLRVDSKGRTAEDRFPGLVQQFRDLVVRKLRFDLRLQWVYIETAMLGPNPKALRDQAQVIGAIRAILLDYSITHSLVDPGTWKKATVGNGHATKEEIKLWAQQMILGAADDQKAPQDFYDACCIAAFGAPKSTS